MAVLIDQLARLDALKDEEAVMRDWRTENDRADDINRRTLAAARTGTAMEAKV